MNTKLLIYSDLHLYAPHALPVGIFKYGPQTVFLGDNFDFKNCKNHDLELIRYDFNSHINRCKETNSILVTGNHELVQFNTYYIMTLERSYKILFIHGDEIDYGTFGMSKWRDKKAGISPFIWSLRHIFIGKKLKRKKSLSSNTVINAIELANRYNVQCIVFGHYHLAPMFDETIKGIRIISVPRGISEIDVSPLDAHLATYTQKVPGLLMKEVSKECNAIAALEQSQNLKTS